MDELFSPHKSMKIIDEIEELDTVGFHQGIADTCTTYITTQVPGS